MPTAGGGNMPRAREYDDGLPIRPIVEGKATERAENGPILLNKQLDV